MAKVEISKIKLRRGTNDQRRYVVFDQGEPVYTTDTKRLFIGTGTLSGGVVVGSKIHPPLINYSSLESLDSQIGDIVMANNKMYQLTAVDFTNINSWADVSTRIDPTLFQYNGGNALTLKYGAISSSYINPNTVLSGIKIDSGIMQLDYDSSVFDISSNKLVLRSGTIGTNQIASSALSYGLVGGSGSVIKVDIDPKYFIFNGNKLSLSAAPTTVFFDSLCAQWFADGLSYNPGLQKIKVVTAAPVIIDGSNNVGLQNLNLANKLPWSRQSIDQYGRTIATESEIFDCLSGIDTSISIFNGFPDRSMGPSETTIFHTLSINSGGGSAVVVLSSAGFVTFQESVSTISGKTVNRFAIPIFRY